MSSINLLDKLKNTFKISDDDIINNTPVAQ